MMKVFYLRVHSKLIIECGVRDLTPGECRDGKIYNGIKGKAGVNIVEALLSDTSSAYWKLYKSLGHDTLPSLDTKAPSRNEFNESHSKATATS
jgi:hypothetical protein